MIDDELNDARRTYTIDLIVQTNSKRIRFTNPDTNACRNISYKRLYKFGIENIAFSRATC